MTRPLLLLLCWLLMSSGVWAGASRSFDGANDRLTVTAGDGSVFDSDTSLFSIIAWINTTGTSQTIYGANADSSDVNADQWKFRLTSGGLAQFFFSAGPSNSNANAVSTTTVNDGTWYCIVGVRSATKTGVIYVNGIQEASSTYTGVNTAIGITANVFFGEQNAGTEDYSGGIAYATYHNSSIPSGLIFDACILPEQSFGTNQMLLPLWGSDSPELDLTGNGRTATVTSGTTESFNGPPVMFGDGLPL